MAARAPRCRIPAAVLGRFPAAILAMSPMLRAQADFTEIEPNGTKAEANVVACLSAGDTLSGKTTGAGAGAGDTTAASGDTFRVQTCALPLSLYRHELVLTTAGTAGHVGSIRGLTQTSGVPDAGTDVALQTSSTATIPPRMNAWYGFGNAEEVYYRVTGTASTTTSYTSTLSTTTAGSSAIGTFAPGSITLTACGQGHTTDTDLWVYDSSPAAIPGFGNDDASPACIGHALGSTLTRTFSAGNYFLAISNFNVANDLGSTGPGEGFATGIVLDLPDAAANSSPTDPLNVGFAVTDINGTTPVVATKSGDFGIVWFSFTVGAGVPGVPLCEPGVSGVLACVCANPNGAGRGCANTGSTGATLSSAGTASLASDAIDPGSVTLTGTDMLSGSSSIFLQGNALLGAGSAFGAGIRCTGGSLKRLYVKSLVGAGGLKTAPEIADASISNRSAALGDALAPGATRWYQTYYRDPGLPNPGGGCPPIATFNITSGQAITWNP